MKRSLLLLSIIAITGCSTTPESGYSNEFQVQEDKVEDLHEAKYGAHTFKGEWVDTLYVDRGLYEHAVVAKSDLKPQSNNERAYNQILEKATGIKTESESNNEDSVEPIKADVSVTDYSHADAEIKCASKIKNDHEKCGCPLKEKLLDSCDSRSEVFFELDSSILSSESKVTLDNLVKDISGPIEIVGYADSVGEAFRNSQLAIERAQSVKDYLNAKGVSKVSVSAGVTASNQGELFRKAFIVGLK